MRIALIADTHGWLDPRIASAVAGVEQVVHAGDVGAGAYDALSEIGVPTSFVAGNADLADSDWPLTTRLELPGGVLGLVHGHQWRAQGRHARIRTEFADARAVVYGHSHRRVDDASAGPWLINPGAAGKTRAYDGPSLAVLIAEHDAWRLEWHVFEPYSKRAG